jgi:uncharacterized protein YndB with AHSA1/START domain
MMVKNAQEQFVVDKTVRIEAPQEAIFKLLTEPEQLRRWIPMTDFEARVGGNIRMQKNEWIAVGQIVELDPPNSVAFTWDWQNEPIGARTVVKYELKKDGTGTLVRLTHTGLPSEERAKNHHEGWVHYLGRLKTVAIGGDPGPDIMPD